MHTSICMYVWSYSLVCHTCMEVTIRATWYLFSFLIYILYISMWFISLVLFKPLFHAPASVTRFKVFLASATVYQQPFEWIFLIISVLCFNGTHVFVVGENNFLINSLFKCVSGKQLLDPSVIAVVPNRSGPAYQFGFPRSFRVPPELKETIRVFSIKNLIQLDTRNLIISSYV